MTELRTTNCRWNRRALLLPALLLLIFQFIAIEPLQAAQQESTRQQAEPQIAAPLTPRQIAELKGDIFMARKMYSEGIEAYEELLKTEPKNAELLNKIGVGYSSLTKLDTAKKYYERAVKVNPKYSAALNNLGTVHFYQKRFRRAIKTYERAIALRPDSATFFGNMGHAWFADKKYPEAIAAWSRALALDPTVFEQRGQGGTVLQASSVEQRSVFYFYMAKTYASLGNAERCARFLKRAIDEGYKNIAGIEKDPAFASVINDPLVKEVLEPFLVPPPNKPSS